jgi:hypothetical protein
MGDLDIGGKVILKWVLEYGYVLSSTLQDRVHWWAFMEMVMKLRGPIKGG